MLRTSRALCKGAVLSSREVVPGDSLSTIERIAVAGRKSLRSAWLKAACAGVMFALVGAGSAKAAVLLNDNFDGYANQTALQAAWPTIATTTDTTKQNIQLSTAQAQSTTNSVYVPVSTTATSTSTEYRNRRSFSETSTQSSSGNLGIGDQLVWSFDFYDTNPAGSPQRNFAPTFRRT